MSNGLFEDQARAGAEEEMGQSVEKALCLEPFHYFARRGLVYSTLV